MATKRKVEDEILQEGEAQGAQPKSTPKIDDSNPNASLDLSQFDYKNLKEDEMKRYMEFVAKLPETQKYDFEVYSVEPVREVRFEGVKDSPIDTVGIRIKEEKPLKTTRITTRAVNMFNGTGKSGKNYFTIEGGQWVHNGGNPGIKHLFYLLKK